MQILPNKKSFRLTKEDFRFEWYSGSGNGGSNRNKHQNCCRCFHDPSGACGTSQDQRDAPTNKKLAFQRCTNSAIFKNWAINKLKEIEEGKSAEEWVQNQMKESNLIVETKRGGKWVEIKESELI